MGEFLSGPIADRPTGSEGLLWLVTDSGQERLTVFQAGQWFDATPSLQNGSGLIPTTYLGTGTPDGTMFLAGDRQWKTIDGGGPHAASHQHSGNDEIATATPAANAIPKADANGKLENGWLDSGAFETAGAVAAHQALGDPHPAYQLESQKSQADGYAALDNGVRVPTTQLGAGSANNQTFLRGDQTWATPPGGAGQMIVPLVSDGAGITWSNMPAAVTFFAGSHRFASKLDLTNYSQVRLIVNKQAVAGLAGSVVRLRYTVTFSTNAANWLQIGTSSVQVAVDVQNTVLDSGWIDLVAGAKADVFIVLDGSGGNGTLDPVFGSIVAQFR
jgi:hypothetical protein